MQMLSCGSQWFIAFSSTHQEIFVLLWVRRKKRKWCTWPPKMQVINAVICFFSAMWLITNYIYSQSSVAPPTDCNPSFLPSSLRVRQAWDLALRRGGQGAGVQEENSDPDRCPGRGAAEADEQALTEGSTALWRHHPMYENDPNVLIENAIPQKL